MQKSSLSRILYFHTGTHKTGSTALQAYLASNKDRLENVGISYEFPSGSNPALGNGQSFYELVHKHKISGKDLDEQIELYLAGRNAAICSSEDLTGFNLADWQRVKDTCEKLQVQVRTVTFVRDIAPFYYSLHGQLVKGGESYGTFAEFSERDQYFPVLDSLRSMLQVFGREAMSVVHYEAAVGQMDKAFMSALGLSPEQFDRTSLEKRINRSLTEYEKEHLSRINKALGSQYSYEVSSMLMSRRPALSEAQHIPPSVVERLAARHSTDVEWINQVFFGSDDEVRIHTGSAAEAATELDSARLHQAIDWEIAEWCLAKLEYVLQNAKSIGIEAVAEQLRAIDWSRARNPLVPDDFDPIAYLLINVDVLKAKIPPYLHYISSGHKETRSWKWPRTSK